VNITTVLLLAAALIGIGVWGALAQQTFVMVLMGIELMVNGIILAAAGFWAYSGGGEPKGQVLVIVAMAVMAVEMAVGFFLAGYAAATVAAFAVVTELRGRTAITAYRGIATAHPWLAAGLVLALLSLVGVPALSGFVGKLTLFTATIDGGYAWLAAVAVANTVVSLFYYLRVI
jgi:NADH:ubiquinone oxidoreductase subunit 2 (subunit N)